MPDSRATHQRNTSRQGPGSACEECRRRKLRCDRQPQCQNCIDAGVYCVTNLARPARGPKKGHLKVLKGRIATLERCLLEERDGVPPDPGSDDELLGKALSASSPASLSPDPAEGVSESVLEDLDQVFFERVQPLVPILQRNRYFTWAREPHATASRRALQQALRTLAAGVSTQPPEIRTGLYRATRQTLDSLEVDDPLPASLEVEQIQAWILVAIYEFMQVSYPRGWMSAGRVFRLVQLIRLPDIDASPVSLLDLDPGWVVAEEKRRTVWMAYIMDCALNLRHKGSLTLTEQALTRLPMPEGDFQRGQAIPMGFLAETLAGTDVTSPLSSFAKCVLLASLSGRTLSHRHLSLAEHVCGHSPQDVWTRHQWIDTTLTAHLQLWFPLGSPAECTDPMLLFAQMIGQTAVLSLYDILQATLWETEAGGLLLEYEASALRAARETITLAHNLRHLSCFKVHPFTPIPLSLCAEFLRLPVARGEATRLLGDVQEAQRYLMTVNRLARQEPTQDLGLL
ncbi:fungal-specific transcription factor domain protein [Aspergillus ellipticus CBS 707.79]|uniref:Fungal-specific transcription factor domain protein n=1 Tax=Aspergillus ellipticus CBS 707.79 TaxID=1448320 RepID=A0A319DLG1_9EURO|nr:fungal-specific transcription factor domain protein [Aspergillus ellipticus CBS 707.79]